MTKEQDALDAKYRLIVKLCCIAAIIALTIIDAAVADFEAPLALHLGLVGVIGGLETAEQRKRIMRRKRPQKRQRRKR